MSKKAEEHDDDSDEEVEQTKAGAEVKEAVVEDTTLANSDVTTKYIEAGRIVQAVLLELTALCVPGARVVDLCKAGDAMIEQKASLIFRNKNKAGKVVEKGIAFPTCVSVNEIVCHYSPLSSEDVVPALVEGDLVKIDLGVHVDGYIAGGAHTAVVPAGAAEEMVVEGKEAVPVPAITEEVLALRSDVFTAAWTAAEVAAKLIKPGNTNAMVTEAVQKIASAYGVRAIIHTTMHEMKRFVLDGKKTVQLSNDVDQKSELCTFEPYEVYCIDVAMSSGDGRSRPTEHRSTVFKRNVDRKYGLKVKASRMFFNEVNKKYPTVAFGLRNVGDEQAAKMGVRECVNHELLSVYPVLAERSGDQIAHVKLTVLLLASGTVKITGLPQPDAIPASLKPLPEEVTAVLQAEDLKARRKKNKKAKKKAAADVEDEDDA